MGVGQNQTTRGPQVLVHVSIYWVPVGAPQRHMGTPVQAFEEARREAARREEEELAAKQKAAEQAARREAARLQAEKARRDVFARAVRRAPFFF